MKALSKKKKSKINWKKLWAVLDNHGWAVWSDLRRDIKKEIERQLKSKKK